MNVLLSAAGRRAYLVEYFKQVAHPLGGRVYATNMIRETTGILAADAAEIVPPSVDPKYVDVMIGLCKKWKIKLLFSLHDWDAPIIAHARQKFLDVGTIPVMGSEGLLIMCLDKFATVQAMGKIGVKCPKTVLSAEEALACLSFPMIVKPRWGQGSLGLYKVEDREELMAACKLSELRAKRFAVVCPWIDATQSQIVIQECVPGPEFGCDIVNDLAGKFRKAFVKHKFAMRSGETEAAESVEHPVIDVLAATIGEKCGHLGCMDSDWMIGADGEPYLIELNPRFGGGYPFTHCAGANVPKACVQWALGQDDESWCRDYTYGVRMCKEMVLKHI